MRNKAVQRKLALTLACLILTAAVLGVLHAVRSGSSHELGVVLQDSDQGAVVLAVAPDSAAGRAGIAPGDLLLALDGEPVTTGFSDGCFTPVSQRCTLTLERGGRRMQCDLKP